MFQWRHFSHTFIFFLFSPPPPHLSPPPRPQYSLTSLENNSYATAAATTLAAAAKRVDDAVATAAAQAQHARAELKSLQLPQLSQLSQLPAAAHDAVARTRQSVVDSAWFARVEAIVGLKERIFAAASASYEELARAPATQSYAAFAAALETRLAAEWNERLRAPATAFYAAAQEKYGAKNGKIEYAELFADVRRSLGAAWEAQVLAAYAHLPAARVYNACVDFAQRARVAAGSAQGELESLPARLSAANAHALAAHVRAQIGSLWDERLHEPLAQWMRGAQAAAHADMGRVVAALDYDADGAVSPADALHAGQDLLAFVRRHALVAAANTVDYWLPESQQPGAVEAVTAAPQVPASSATASDPTLAALYATTSSRVHGRIAPYVSHTQQRLQPYVAQLQQLGALGTTAVARVQTVVQPYVANARAFVAHQSEQHSGLIAYAQQVVAQGQERAQGLATQARGLASEAARVAEPHTARLRVAVADAHAHLASLRAHAGAALAATHVPAAQATAAAKAFYAQLAVSSSSAASVSVDGSATTGAAPAHAHSAWREVPASTLQFLAQSIGVRPRDAAYDETVRLLRELVHSLRVIVSASAAAATQPLNGEVVEVQAQSEQPVVAREETQAVVEGSQEQQQPQTDVEAEVFYEAESVPVSAAGEQ